MKQYHNLYVSRTLQLKKEQVLEKIEKNMVQMNIYLIVLTKNGKNQLEIYDSVMNKQKYFLDNAFLLVGIAEGYDDALRLTETIMADIYSRTGKAEIRTYLLEQQQRFEEGVGR